MEPLLSSEQSKKADRYATQTLGIPEAVLMEHAALAVVKALQSRFSNCLPKTRGVIFAGPGNNGGDAIACARILFQSGCRNITLHLSDKSHSIQLKMAKTLGVPLEKRPILSGCDWIVDGIFGTGISRPIEGEYIKRIEAINAAKSWVVSIDIPSGLSSETGMPLGVAVIASETVTLGFIKKGLVTGEAANYVGKLSFDRIQIPRKIPALEKEDCLLFGAEDAKANLPPRKPADHKGTYGHVFIWAGAQAKQGASAMTALAALRAGAGLVTAMGDSSTIDAIRPRLPKEVMTEIFRDSTLFQRKVVAAIGPGMGLSEEKWDILAKVLESQWNVVLDADALTLMAERKLSRSLVKEREGQTILTPHPREASRLLGVDVSSIQADRFAACEKLADTYSSVIVLKGRGTLIKKPGGPCYVVNQGDTGLSKGGSGDVLTGIIASFTAQGLSPEVACALGCYVQGRASELLTQRFGHARSTLASEITETIPLVFKEIESCKQSE